MPTCDNKNRLSKKLKYDSCLHKDWQLVDGLPFPIIDIWSGKLVFLLKLYTVESVWLTWELIQNQMRVEFYTDFGFYAVFPHHSSFMETKSNSLSVCNQILSLDDCNQILLCILELEKWLSWVFCHSFQGDLGTTVRKNALEINQLHLLIRKNNKTSLSCAYWM